MRETPRDKIYATDCLKGLKQLPDGCIQCCVTSPPYYKLRDYHIDGQLGMEISPEAYVERLVDVFSEVKRVLKPDGVVWLNLGDSYWGSGKASSNPRYIKGHKEFGRVSKRDPSCFGMPVTGKHAYIKSKDLIGIPWMVAFALRKAGWWLRQDIIWHKPTVMPESVTDRCTKAHEYIFLLAKNKKYYFDNEAIKTDAKAIQVRDRFTSASKKGASDPYVNHIREAGRGPYLKANRRSVWSITNRPFKGGHFATFPSELPELCIKAGSHEGDLILDPFMGAGTTALAAKKLGRNYIGFEINPDYVQLAGERLVSNTGYKP